MGLYDDYATDKDLEQEGTVRPYGEDVWIKLARAGGSNKRYAKALKQKTEKYRRAIEIGKLPDAEATRIMIEVYAEAVVLGWGGEGMVDDTGKPLAFTKENVIKVFTDLPDLFSQVQRDAGDAESFKQASREADAED